MGLTDLKKIAYINQVFGSMWAFKRLLAFHFREKTSCSRRVYLIILRTPVQILWPTGIPGTCQHLQLAVSFLGRQATPLGLLEMKLLRFVLFLKRKHQQDLYIATDMFLFPYRPVKSVEVLKVHKFE